jgi:rhodanese-related sulfurtransferase
MKKLLLLLLLSLMSSSLFAANYPDISIDDLEKAISDKKVVVIDVNGNKSFKSGHIPSAINFASEGKKLASKLPADKNTLIVAYCGGPSCGAYQKAAKAAAKLGYTNIKHLSAGISGWMKAGKTLSK